MAGNGTTQHIYLCPEGVSANINGRDYNFYPISLKAAFKLKNVARPIVQAVVHWLDTLQQTQTTSDIGRTFKKIEQKDGTKLDETVVSPIDLKLAEFRSGQRNSTVLVLIEALMNPANADMLAEVICDSLRDEFARPIKPGDWQQFTDLDLPTAKAFLFEGLFPANRKVLGPFESRVASQVARLNVLLPEGSNEKLQASATGGASQNQ